MHHTSWTLREGAPGQVAALAQTGDGTLWLGTPSGLFEFDGVRFSRFQPAGSAGLLSEGIFSLASDAEGCLWVGYSRGGISRICQGAVRSFGSTDGIPARGAVQRLSVGPSGEVWANTYKGVFRYADHRWTVETPPKVMVEGVTARMVLADRRGNVWLALNEGLLVRPQGSTAFQAVDGDGLDFIELSEAPDGRVWMVESRIKRGARPAPMPGVVSDRDLPWRPFSPRAATPLWDRDGALWFGTTPGLKRWTPAIRGDGDDGGDGRIDTFDEDRGLSGGSVRATLEDREGNIWLGTNGGLDRFRANRLLPADLPKGALKLALATGLEGTTWVTVWNQGLFALADGMATLVPEVTFRQASSLLQSRRGPVYIAGTEALFRYQAGKLEQMPLPGTATRFGSEVQTMAEDDTGALWVAVRIDGLPLFRVDADGWHPYGDLPDLPRDIPQVMFGDSRSQLWFGYAGNKVAMLAGGKVRTYGTDDGLSVGSASAFAESHGGLLLAGERGVFAFDGKRFRALRATDASALSGVTGVVETPSGDVWLNTSSGIVRLRKRDIDQAWASPTYAMPFERFDALDGLPGYAEQVRPLPTATIDARGRLWFALTNGVVSIDPDRVPHNPVAPQARVERLKAGAQWFEGSAHLDLPAGPTDLVFDYTAASLAVPERVTFRYRLDGVDADWQEAGTRRQAFYTQLPPGDYHFRVMAANEDGVWGPEAMSSGIGIAPALHQTWWFRLGLAALIAAVSWWLYRRRLQQVSERVRVSVTARQAERERIAGELHDTLIQNVQGLLFTFQAAVAKSSLQEAEARHLNLALDRAESTLVQGREQLSGMLRAPASQDYVLSEALRALTQELSALGEATIDVSSDGDETRVRPEVRDACFWSTREGLLNAVRHSGAERIHVDVNCEGDGLRVRVGDDGLGLPEGLTTNGVAGHLGIPTMKTRIEAQGGEFRFVSTEVGMTIEFWIPAKAAYTPRPRWRR